MLTYLLFVLSNIHLATITQIQKKSPTLVKIFNVALALAIFAGVIAFLVIDSLNEDAPERLYSLLGIFAFVLFGFLISAHPGHIRWRHVIWGLGIGKNHIMTSSFSKYSLIHHKTWLIDNHLEFVFGLMILRWEIGKNIFQCIGDKVTAFLGFTDAGSGFVYGRLADPENFPLFDINSLNMSVIDVTSINETQIKDIVTALDSIDEPLGVWFFSVLCVIYFFSFFTSMLSYLGILQFIVFKMGWMLNVTVGTTAAESLNAAGNVFLGQTEAPLLIRPFLKDMTKYVHFRKENESVLPTKFFSNLQRSEIHAVMTGGFATVAGTVLGAYVKFGIPADKVISASVMAAPTALAVSKLLYPETETSKTSVKDIKMPKATEANVLDAAAQGASNAIMLVLNIGASLIAFLAFVAFLDALIGKLQCCQL